MAFGFVTELVVKHRSLFANKPAAEMLAPTNSAVPTTAFDKFPRTTMTQVSC